MNNPTPLNLGKAAIRYDIKDDLCVICRNVDWMAWLKGGPDATAPHHSRFGNAVQAAAEGCRLCSFIVAKFNEQRAKAENLESQDRNRDPELSLDIRKSIDVFSIDFSVVDLVVHFKDKSKESQMIDQKARSTQERQKGDSSSKDHEDEETIYDKDNWKRKEKEDNSKFHCRFGISVPFRRQNVPILSGGD